MIKTQLYLKCINADLEKLFKQKNYKWFTKGEYNLNIVGVRSNNRNKITNLFDDILIVDYNTSIAHRRVCYNITTEPGYTAMKNGINPKGTAILVPNQYCSCWKLGYHKGKYKALCQAKPVQVYRDNNKDDIYDLEPKTIDNGIFGINIHRAHKELVLDKIDMYSAGCQVFNNPIDFNSFIRLCQEQESRYGNSFTYTLINESDLDEIK